MMNNSKIAYFFKRGREGRAENGGPSEFLYGYPELIGAGLDVSILTDGDFGFSKHPGLGWRLVNHIIYVLFGIPGWALAMLWCKKHVLNQYDVVVVTTNTFGICASVLGRLGFVRSKIVFLAMGLVDFGVPARHKAIFRWALEKTHVMALSQADAVMLNKTLGREIKYIPFGVDDKFWCPGREKERINEFVLSIGNDRHRDYDTLVAAWQDDYPHLCIVTKIKIDTLGKKNIELIAGDWHSRAISDYDIRQLVRQCKFAVIPVGNTSQPSGQSAALQAMACGKAVVLTDFPGLWNRELMVSEKTCLLSGAPGDVQSLSNSIAKALADSELLSSIGSNARNLVEQKLNTRNMAEHLAMVLKNLS
jgi:glycosyltransferase involved in cell wall biosynthesis